ncbi:MAG: lipid II:glycine glycyltransferase FemX [bacterium]
MIQVESYNSFDSDEWRSLIKAVGGNVFHLQEIWLAENNPGSICYLVLRNDKDIIGACIGVRQEKRYLKLFRSSGALYLPTVPAISDAGQGIKDHIYESLLSFAVKSGFDFLKIGVRWGTDLSHNPRLNKFIDGHLIEFTIGLKDDMDTIKSSFHKKHRKNIRKACENDIEIVTDNSLDGLMMLKRLQESSSERASTKGNVYNIQNETYFIELYEHIYKKKLGNIIFARKDQTYVAGLAYLFFNNKAITVRSGVLPEGYVISAPYYLQYELIRQLKEKRYEIINIGGVPEDASNPSHPQHGLYQFKKGFGTDANIRTGLRIPTRR